MSAIVVCLDCPHYQKGGWCRLMNKTVGALTPACDKYTQTPEDLTNEKRSATTKECRKCKRILPVEQFAKCSHMVDGLQSYCKECSAEMYKAWAERKKKSKTNENPTNMETTPTTTKRCPRCERELPAESFGKHARTKDGLQPYCRECRSESRKGKTSRPGRDTKSSYIKTSERPKTLVVREALTDKQMVDLLREHGWNVTCERTITEKL